MRGARPAAIAVRRDNVSLDNSLALMKQSPSQLRSILHQFNSHHGPPRGKPYGWTGVVALGRVAGVGRFPHSVFVKPLFDLEELSRRVIRPLDRPPFHRRIETQDEELVRSKFGNHRASGRLGGGCRGWRTDGPGRRPPWGIEANQEVVVLEDQVAGSNSGFLA